MDLEASELPKGLVLGRDENIHIRLTGSTPLNDVGSYIIGMVNKKYIAVVPKNYQA